jgi:phosphocarrier protein HPr
MPEIKKEIVIANPQGLHARPAAMFVQIVSKYNSKVIVSKGDEEVSGKSIMGILTLGAQANTTLYVSVEGNDAEVVMNELEELLTRKDF